MKEFYPYNSFGESDKLSEGLGTLLLMKNLREWNEPFILGYTKCKAFCWFSRWSDKRSFSILSKTKTICPKDVGLSLLSLGWEENKN